MPGAVTRLQRPGAERTAFGFLRESCLASSVSETLCLKRAASEKHSGLGGKLELEHANIVVALLDLTMLSQGQLL